MGKKLRFKLMYDDKLKLQTKISKLIVSVMTKISRRVLYRKRTHPHTLTHTYTYTPTHLHTHTLTHPHTCTLTHNH